MINSFSLMIVEKGKIGLTSGWELVKVCFMGMRISHFTEER